MTDRKDAAAPSIPDATRDQLASLASEDLKVGIQAKFTADEGRVDNMSFQADGLYIDFSKTHISAALMHTYRQLSEDIGFTQKRHALFAGKRINSSENRSVLHTLLRDADNQGIAMELPETIEQARASKAEFLAQYRRIEEELAQRAKPVTDIIHVGIGGSSLGTQLVVQALSGLGAKINVHFIGNIDAHQLVDVLDRCETDSTLVIGVSKTFTTTETLQNLESIAAWFKQQGLVDPLQNFYAVTAAPQKAIEYGIAEKNAVAFPEWVGGRYSVWSSVSLSAALVIGIERFEEFLAGAAQIDRHFYHADADQNICFIGAMLDHYYCNYIGAGSRAIFAYDYRLRSLVDYLQQLETESNGKDRQRNGRKVDQLTSPVVWGGVGTDVQHSVFQMLHQGTQMIPCEFILVKHPDHDLTEHHTELLANGVAQSAALLAGQDYATVCELNSDNTVSEAAKRAKVFSGERPSTTILLDRLTPKSLGALLAFYEHRTFCFGLLTNINSFDQMGVELGKRLAKEVKPQLELRAQKSAEGFDPSTLDLLNRLKD